MEQDYLEREPCFPELSDCVLCPRECHANRNESETGICGMGAKVRVARAALHMWEEPCISGERGSGTIFFAGCSLRCCFCQNRDIAIGNAGKDISLTRLVEIMMELQEKGAANINLVTGEHYVLHIAEAIRRAKKKGLRIPVLYNSGGYEKTETLRLLEGLVDIWLPDYKYQDSSLAGEYSRAADYPEIAMNAIREMVRQSGPCVFDGEGYLVRGTVVRHLILPGHTKNSKAAVKDLYETFGDQIYISLMNQYTPVCHQEKFTELNRKVTKREYEKVLDFALSLGITRGFFQEGDTSRESFIPAFDYEGV